jgi:hypothetical protein
MLCRKLQPTYCYQIDSGTTLAPEASAKLVKQMDRGLLYQSGQYLSAADKATLFSEKRTPGYR